MIEKKFNWQETISCPPGYPVDVYQGGLEQPYVSLYLGTHTGKGGWGHSGRSMSSGIKPVPKRLNVTWLSYAEDTFYHIDTLIDQQKMIELFEQGYTDYYTRKKTTYDTIIVGFAPGGVVVIWLMGAGRQVEVARYQGYKTVIPDQEIARLDSHEHLLFEPEYRKKIMLNEKIVPKEVQQTNAGKPIPYGIWDTYRERYHWKPVFEIQKKGIIDEASFSMYNGEKETLFDQSLDTTFEKRAIPKTFSFTWKDRHGQRYAAVIEFDEKEIFNAFSVIKAIDPEAEIEFEFQTDLADSYVVLTLKSKKRTIALFESAIEVYKSLKK